MSRRMNQINSVISHWMRTESVLKSNKFESNLVKMIGIFESDDKYFLVHSIARGHFDIVRMIFGINPVSVNEINRQSGTTTLQWACLVGHLALVKTIIGTGELRKDIMYAQNEHSGNALHALINGATRKEPARMIQDRLKIMDILVNNLGFDLNEPNLQGHTPFFIAGLKEIPDLIFAIMDHSQFNSIDLGTIKNDDSEDDESEDSYDFAHFTNYGDRSVPVPLKPSSFRYLCEENKPSMIRAILNHKRWGPGFFNEKTLSDDHMSRILWNVCGHGYHGILQIFSEYPRFSRYLTSKFIASHHLWQKAIERGHLKIVKIIVNHVISHETRDKLVTFIDPESVLLHAARNGHEHLIDYFLGELNPKYRLKIKVDQEAHDRNTAAIIAARHGHSSVLSSLINHGANIFSQNRYNETCLNRCTDLATMQVMWEHTRKTMGSHPELCHFINAQSQSRKETVLHTVARTDDLELIRYVLKNIGPYLNIWEKNRDKQTARDVAKVGSGDTSWLFDLKLHEPGHPGRRRENNDSRLRRGGRRGGRFR